MMSKDYPNLRSFLQILPLSGLTYSINCFSSLLLVFFTFAICTSYVLWLKNYLISFLHIIFRLTVLMVITYRGWNVLLFDSFLVISLSYSFSYASEDRQLSESIIHVSINFAVEQLSRENLLYESYSVKLSK